MVSKIAISIKIKTLKTQNFKPKDTHKNYNLKIRDKNKLMYSASENGVPGKNTNKKNTNEK